MSGNGYTSSIKRAFTGVLAFLLAYIIVVGTYQLVLGLMCMRFGHTPTITFNKLNNMPLRAYDWSYLSVSLIFSAGAVWLLVLGVIGRVLFLKLTGITLLRYFLLWLSLLSFNFVLVLFTISMAGDINYQWGLYQGLANIVSWWAIPLFVTIPVAGIAMGLSIATGFALSGSFLKFIYSAKTGARIDGRRQFIFVSCLLPAVIAFVALLPLLSRYSLIFHAALILNLLLIGVGIIIGSDRLIMGVKAHRGDVLNRVPVLLLIVVAGVYGITFLWFR